MSLRLIKFVHSDILALYDKIGFNEFLYSDVKEIPLRYSLKKLTNEGVIIKSSKVDNRIHYKLSKFIVDQSQKYRKKMNDHT